VHWLTNRSMIFARLGDWGQSLADARGALARAPLPSAAAAKAVHRVAVALDALGRGAEADDVLGAAEGGGIDVRASREALGGTRRERFRRQRPRGPVAGGGARPGGGAGAAGAGGAAARSHEGYAEDLRRRVPVWGRAVAGSAAGGAAAGEGAAAAAAAAAVLGVGAEGLGSPGAAGAVRRAFLRAAARAHPDKGGSEEEFARVHAAYVALRGPAGLDGGG